MAKNGLMKTAKIYPLMVDTRSAPSMAEVMLKDLIAGEIDAAILWGPMAGYYAKQLGGDLVVVPLVKDKAGSRMVYRITMGVRPVRPGLEADIEHRHSRQSEGNQQDPARFRRSADRRAGPAHHPVRTSRVGRDWTCRWQEGG